MEKWDHMFVEAKFQGGEHELTAFHSNGAAETLSADSATPRQLVVELAELGANGWQLIAMEDRLSPLGGSARIYWLKRRAQ